MTNACANCGEENARRQIGCPVEWANYLREERDVIPIGRLVIPLCGECYPEFERLRETALDLGWYDEDIQGEIEAEIHALLDDLDTGAMIDEP